jgi:transposase-like protein
MHITVYCPTCDQRNILPARLNGRVRIVPRTYRCQACRIIHRTQQPEDQP